MNIALLVGAAASITWLTSSTKEERTPSIREQIKDIISKKSVMPNYKDFPYSVIDGDDDNDFVDPMVEFKSITTDVVTNEFLAQKAALFNFLELVIQTFTDGLRIYCEERSIDPERIRFIYKGGNILRIVASEFVLELPGHAADIINEFYMPFFKRSDADFSIYIDPQLPDWDNIIIHLTHLSWILQQIIRTKLTSEPWLYFDYYRLNDDAKKRVLETYLQALQNADGLKNPLNTRFYGGKFVGIAFEDSYVGQTVDELSAQEDGFVSYDKSHAIVTFAPSPEIASSFRIQVNTALDFEAGSTRSVFNLIRTKVIFAAKFVNGSGEDSVIRFGGELIDVSLPKREDKSLAKFFKHSDSISTYELKFGDRTLSFLAYGLRTLIDDLDTILFVKNDHPWDDAKYVKRLNRLFYLCFVELFINFGSNAKRRQYAVNWAKNIAAIALNNVDTLRKSVKTTFKEQLGFDRLAQRISQVSQLPSSGSFVEYKEFVEHIQNNCVVILSSFKSIGEFCSRTGIKVKKQSIYDASLNALIRGED